MEGLGTVVIATGVKRQQPTENYAHLTIILVLKLVLLLVIQQI